MPFAVAPFFNLFLCACLSTAEASVAEWGSHQVFGDLGSQAEAAGKQHGLR